MALLPLTALALPFLQGAGDLQLNEIYVSHSGTDTLEYIELLGSPGLMLDGYMVLVVEGDDPSFGTLDRAWDLTGNVVPGDGLFVLGDSAVAEADYGIGDQDRIENGTDTFYLVQASDASAIIAMVGSDVSTGPDTTSIPALATLLDLVALVDADATDRTYDGALVRGPDGTFLPAGIYRGGGLLWCEDFLDFEPGPDRSPGAPNQDCEGIGTSVCQSLPSSTGAPALISASGSDLAGAGNQLTLTAEPVPDQPGIFFFGPNPIRVPFGNGFLCVGGGLTRLLPPVAASGQVAQKTIDNAPFAIGDVRYFQYWFRDPAGGGAAFNTSDAVGVTFR